jgi:hypothetical protein
MHPDTIRPIDDHLPWAAGYAGDALRCANHALYEHGDEAELVEALECLERAKALLDRMKKRTEKRDA